MAQDNVHRLQDTFLEHLQRKKTPVTIFLNNGVRLQGTVVGFDAFCVLLENNGQQQIVYKHAITTTLPAAAVDLQDKSGPVEKIPAAKPARVIMPSNFRRSRAATSREHAANIPAAVSTGATNMVRRIASSRSKDRSSYRARSTPATSPSCIRAQADRNTDAASVPCSATTASAASTGSDARVSAARRWRRANRLPRSRTSIASTARA